MMPSRPVSLTHGNARVLRGAICGAICGATCGAICGATCGAICGTTCGAICGASLPELGEWGQKPYTSWGMTWPWQMLRVDARSALPGGDKVITDQMSGTRLQCAIIGCRHRMFGCRGCRGARWPGYTAAHSQR